MRWCRYCWWFLWVDPYSFCRIIRCVEPLRPSTHRTITTTTTSHTGGCRSSRFLCQSFRATSSGTNLNRHDHNKNTSNQHCDDWYYRSYYAVQRSYLTSSPLSLLSSLSLSPMDPSMVEDRDRANRNNSDTDRHHHHPSCNANDPGGGSESDNFEGDDKEEVKVGEEDSFRTTDRILTSGTVVVATTATSTTPTNPPPPITISTSQLENHDNDAVRFGRFLIPSNCIFYRSPYCVAFVNLRPIVPGHVLVMPLISTPESNDRITTETPYMFLSQLPDWVYQDVWMTVRNVQALLREHYNNDNHNDSIDSTAATTTSNKVTAFQIAVQDGPGAGQTVPHVHVHILPRTNHDEYAGSSERNDAIYEQLEIWGSTILSQHSNHDPGTAARGDGDDRTTTTMMASSSVSDSASVSSETIAVNATLTTAVPKHSKLLVPSVRRDRTREEMATEAASYRRTLQRLKLDSKCKGSIR